MTSLGFCTVFLAFSYLVGLHDVSTGPEDSRKSSVSSGQQGGRGRKGSKQFAVTLLVSESDKNKIVDMIHRAKSVISKKVEKVMGRGRMPKSGISTAAVMTTVLQNWVEGEEKREEEDSKEVDQLIEQQVRLCVVE